MIKGGLSVGSRNDEGRCTTILQAATIGTLINRWRIFIYAQSY